MHKAGFKNHIHITINHKSLQQSYKFDATNRTAAIKTGLTTVTGMLWLVEAWHGVSLWLCSSSGLVDFFTWARARYCCPGEKRFEQGSTTNFINDWCCSLYPVPSNRRRSASCIRVPLTLRNEIWNLMRCVAYVTVPLLSSLFPYVPSRQTSYHSRALVETHLEWTLYESLSWPSDDVVHLWDRTSQSFQEQNYLKLGYLHDV